MTIKQKCCITFLTILLVSADNTVLRVGLLSAAEPLHHLPSPFSLALELRGPGGQGGQVCTDSEEPATAAVCAEELVEPTDSTAFAAWNEQERIQPVRDLFLRIESSGRPDPLIVTRSLRDLGAHARLATHSTPREEYEQDALMQDLFIRFQPYVTRDFLDATRPPEDLTAHYKISPLDPTDKIYGLGIISDYRLSSWLHLNSSYRFNWHEPGSSQAPTLTRQHGDTSHSLFFGVTVPFRAPERGE